MMGIEFIKMDPTMYVLHYKNGRVKREGAGLSFFYFAPHSTIVAVPLNTIDVPYAFNEVTADFQTVTVQGQMSYRVADPKRLAGLLKYAVDRSGRYVSDDPGKLAERLVHAAHGVARTLIQTEPLKQILVRAETLAASALEKLRAADIVKYHGVEILGFSIVSLRPTPETAKALEAEAREALLRRADEAVYARRNAAVEQERKIKESELETEKSLEEKKKLIREAQMEAEISIEEKRAGLMDQRVVNDKKEADSRAYALKQTLEPVQKVDWRILMALGSKGINSQLLVANAFNDLAENAQKIGILNITPDLLSTLMAGKED